MWGFIQQLRRKLYYFLVYTGRQVQWFVVNIQTPLLTRKVHPVLRWGIRIAITPLIALFFLILVVLTDTPGNSELNNIRNHVASEVYSADSVLLGRYFIQDRTEIAYEEISPAVINALIPTEDVRFYHHNGIDYRSLGRVLVRSILQNDESSGGGSTITQQLAKNLYPRREYIIFPVLINKLREMRIATQLEKMYSKKELLLLYLNTVPFSDNVYGIEAAAQRFFSVSAKDLTIEQAVVLVGMLKGTHIYNPRLFPERAHKRRNVVLSQMRRYGYLPSSSYDSLRTLPITLAYNKASGRPEVAPYFKEFVKNELLKWCQNHKKKDGSPYNLYTDGLKIYTTIDTKLQEYAEQAMVKQMTEIQEVFFKHWGKEEPWKEKEWVLHQAIKRSSRYRQLAEKGMAEHDILKALEKPVRTSLFRWQGPQEVNVSPIDSIKHHLKHLNAGFVVMATTGEVKAWVGGIDYGFFQYDHIKESTKRQVGSVFKPIVFAMALEQGAEPCEFMVAQRKIYVDDEGKEWAPRNVAYDYGVQYSMRGAMAYSVNTVSVKLIEMAGISNTIRLAKKMGISSYIPPVPSIALGSSSISLLEMTGAYACFANEGISVTPYFIRTVVDSEGKVYDDFKPDQQVRAMSKETAQLVTQMLRTVVHEGTASRLRWKYGVYNDVAGKTGTTQDNADGWFMAITPNLVMGAWVGADDPRIQFRSTELGQGSNTALPITAYFLKLLNGDDTYKSVVQSRFSPVDHALQRRLSCDLYELNDDLRARVERTIFQRDSIISTDTLAPPPPESFLERLYKRKMKIMMATKNVDTPEPELSKVATGASGGVE